MTRQAPGRAESARRIRGATPDDARAIAAILRELEWFEHVNAEPPERTEARVATQLARCAADESHTVLVSEDGTTGRVIGYVAAHWIPNLMGGNEGYVSELFVAGTARGAGTGTALLEAVQAAARERGCWRLELFNRRMRDSYARRFYPSRGWTERTDVAFFTLTLEPADA